MPTEINIILHHIAQSSVIPLAQFTKALDIAVDSIFN